MIGVSCGGAGGGGGSYPGSARTSAGTSLASSRESSCASCPGITQPFRIAMLGATGVGKTSLVCQFMTSESLHIYDASIGECILRCISSALYGSVGYGCGGLRSSILSPQRETVGTTGGGECYVNRVLKAIDHLLTMGSIIL